MWFRVKLLKYVPELQFNREKSSNGTVIKRCSFTDDYFEGIWDETIAPYMKQTKEFNTHFRKRIVIISSDNKMASMKAATYLHLLRADRIPTDDRDREDRFSLGDSIRIINMGNFDEGNSAYAGRAFFDINGLDTVYIEGMEERKSNLLDTQNKIDAILASDAGLIVIKVDPKDANAYWVNNLIASGVADYLELEKLSVPYYEVVLDKLIEDEEKFDLLINEKSKLIGDAMKTYMYEMCEERIAYSLDVLAKNTDN